MRLSTYRTALVYIVELFEIGFRIDMHSCGLSDAGEVYCALYLDQLKTEIAKTTAFEQDKSVGLSKQRTVSKFTSVSSNWLTALHIHQI